MQRPQLDGLGERDAAPARAGADRQTTHLDGDDDLINSILGILAVESRDYTIFFRSLSSLSTTDNASSLRDLFIDRDTYDAWETDYKLRLKKENSEDNTRQQHMLATNPKYILRNYLAQQSIEKAESGDFSMVNDLLSVLQKPYDEHPEHKAFSESPPDWGKALNISCSS